MNLEQILQWSFNTFQEDLIDVTSFGYSGMVILHKLKQMNLLPHIPIVTIDTLHLFPETYTFIHEQRKAYNITKFYKYRPHDYTTQSEFDETCGEDFWKENPNEYNYVSKVEPTQRALRDLNAHAWITGRRRDQGGERSKLQILEVDDADRYKINPLVHWSYNDMWEYIRKNDIPYNPLYDRGYKSIGDYMTTAPVGEDAAERTGRFVGLDHTECGIHSTREKILKMKEEAERYGRDFNGIVSLPCSECTYELTPSNFDVIFKSQSMVLLELYSPLCGGCVEFAPIFKKIVQLLKDQDVETGRYDITEHDVPKTGKDIGMEVYGTPDLYILKRDGGLVHYDGQLEFKDIVGWISKEIGISLVV